MGGAPYAALRRRQITAVPGQAAAEQTGNIGRLMLSSVAVLVREKLRIVRAGGFSDATEVQMALIQNLDLHGTRLTSIAARASMTKQSMLELVDKADALGLVERQTDPDDRRAKIIAFTPMGLKMLERVHEGVVLAEQRMAAVMGVTFVSLMKERLGAYVAAAGADALRMSDRNDLWRTRSVNRVLLSASSTFVREVLRAVHERGFDTVAEVHLTLFGNLDLGGTRLTEIASRARMTKQAMAELVDKAEDLGFVARQSDPGDGRAKIVVFTTAGLRLLDQHRKGVVSAELRLATVTGAAFLADLRAQLMAYVASADTANTDWRSFKCD